MSIRRASSHRPSEISFFPARRAQFGRFGAAAAAFFALSCGGGQYGFAREYTPLGAERGHLSRAEQPTYQDLIREPNKYKQVEIGWFGTVTALAQGKDGRTRVTLSLRAHQERHLCSDESRASCRVTVSQAELGTFTADVALGPDEISGKERVWTGSLLKVYGKYTGEYSEETGPVIAVEYHRHWPRGTYVTTAARASMRR